jgi:hypothetical protein
MIKSNFPQLLSGEMIPMTPFYRKGSHKFISAAKQGDVKLMHEMLKYNEYYVYEYDSVRMEK